MSVTSVVTTLSQSVSVLLLFAKEVLSWAVYVVPLTIPVSPALHPEHFIVTPLEAK